MIKKNDSAASYRTMIFIQIQLFADFDDSRNRQGQIHKRQVESLPQALVVNDSIFEFLLI